MKSYWVYLTYGNCALCYGNNESEAVQYWKDNFDTTGLDVLGVSDISNLATV